MQVQFNCKNISISSCSVYSSSLIQLIQIIQAVQYSISIQFSSIQPIDRALSGATTSGQSGPGSNGNEGVLCILQHCSITGTSLSDCLVSYLGYSFVGLTSLQRSSWCILQPQLTGQERFRGTRASGLT